MEAPFDAASWDGISGAIYAGQGSAEGLWLALALGCVAVAVLAGWRHEKHAYDAVKNGRR